jgi:hypothetical protein
MIRSLGLLGLIAGLALLGLTFESGTASAAEPTCSTTLAIVVHGQHVVRDYVTGGDAASTWPPSGGQVGGAVAGSGAVTPGGPGPGFHFPNGFAPGASFCLGQSQSPGNHPGLG